nr:ubiquitin carboxyl-terminal hydrolase 2-like [Lepeophtheirus salmonis]
MNSQIILGLRNEHNDCYINAVIQCLGNFYSVRTFFNPANSRMMRFLNKNSKSNGEVSIEFSRLLEQLRKGQHDFGSKAISKEEDLKEFPSVKALKTVVEKYHSSSFGTCQQDAHEFLIALLNFLHEEMKFGSTSFVKNTFEGKQASTLTCQNCGFESVKDECFYELTLEVGDRRENVRNLSELLASYLTPEPVEWTCSKCQKRGNASKKVDIIKFPKILTIHLSRFCTVRGTEKNLTLVEFDFELNLRAYSVFGSKYQLNSICNHYGGLQKGHYTAFIYSKQDLKWYRADDEIVDEVHYQDVVSNASYILFYDQI